MVEDHTPYKVMESSEYPPGNCFVTASAVGPFIDTGVFIPKERWGQLVLGKDFIAEAARLLGLFDNQEEEIQRAYDKGFADAAKENLSGYLGNALDQLGYAVDVLSSLRDAGDSGVASTGEPEAAEAGGDEPPAADVDSGASTPRRTRKAAGQVAEPAGDEGPAGVPAGAGHDDPFRV